jgi:hypothetical protein
MVAQWLRCKAVPPVRAVLAPEAHIFQARAETERNSEKEGVCEMSEARTPT